MIGLLCFVLAVLASPFKSKLRLEAENAVLRQHFQPADWFRDSGMYSVHSKPNVKTRPLTRRSEHHPEGGPRTSIREHFGYMGIVSLKGDWL
jgi:hypothetical protein